MEKAKHLTSTISRAIWDVDTATMPMWKAGLIGFVRILFAMARDLAEGMLNLRAMSLVYTTLLSLVPLLAISFSVLKGFGVHNQLEPLLLNFLEPMGEKGVEIAEKIIGFVENIKAGVLGAAGLGLLVYTVISLMQKIERAFNYTWHVTEHRSFAQRFSGYLSVIMIGPLLVFSSMGITASVMSTSVMARITSIEPLGTLVGVATWLVPYLLIVGAFTFIYIFLPNTRVRLRSALVGAAVAGVLWKGVGWAFASFLVSSTKYTAVYSAFATLIMFMIWLYVSWLVLLVGSCITFYHQHPEYLTASGGVMKLSNRLKEKVALLIGFLIAESYYRGRPPWTASNLGQRLRVPMEGAQSVLNALEQKGLLTRTGEDPPAYLPARPLETTAVKELLDAVRAAGEESGREFQQPPSKPTVEKLLGDLDEGVERVLDGMTLKDLALGEGPAEETVVGIVSGQGAATEKSG